MRMKTVLLRSLTGDRSCWSGRFFKLKIIGYAIPVIFKLNQGNIRPNKREGSVYKREENIKPLCRYCQLCRVPQRKSPPTGL